MVFSSFRELSKAQITGKMARKAIETSSRYARQVVTGRGFRGLAITHTPLEVTFQQANVSNTEHEIASEYGHPESGSQSHPEIRERLIKSPEAQDFGDLEGTATRQHENERDHIEVEQGQRNHTD